MSTRKRVLLGLIVSMNALGGCCSSSDFVQVFARGTADQGKSCESVCRDAVVTQLQDETETYDHCEETKTDQGAPAVACHYVEETCSTELE
jgi:hypothetical protein